MKPHYTQKTGLASMLFAMLCSTFSAVHGADEPPSSPPEMLADAGLSDVLFLDADRGWAVGDRGVILWTNDGGRRWELADSPVNCRIEAVFFLNAELGWAVGGWTHPYTHKTTGVVLHTNNGGRRWTRSSTDAVPKLRRVIFADKRNGWAVANASPMYPAGLFHSRDGGQHWTPIAPTHWGEWSTGDTDGQGIPWVVGKSGVGALNSSNQLVTRPGLLPDRRQPRAVTFRGSGSAWIVGDGGLVLTTTDGGTTWDQPITLPKYSAESCDFRDVAVVGPSVWIAGSPGSCLFHSPDNGASWQLVKTRQSVPLEALHFIDDQHGWAVGALGTVLATRNGGQTWIRQRGAERVAALGLFSRPESIPLEMFARVAGDEGYLSALQVVTRRRAESGQLVEAPAADRIQEAAVRAGASVGEVSWRFARPNRVQKSTAEAIVQDWDNVLGRDSLAELESLIVQKIRQWRPLIVVTQHPGDVTETPVDFLVNQVVLAAVGKAADETSFPEQLHSLGLEPWRAQKVFAVTTDGSPGSLSLETSRLATRLGRTLNDYVSTSRGLIYSSWVTPPSTLSFDLLLSELPRDIAALDFFRGISMSRSPELRRQPSAIAATDLKSLNRVAQKERNVQQILRRALARDTNATSWLAQLDDLLADLSPTASGDVLFQLAHHYRQEGHLDLSAETLRRLVSQHPDHALSEQAIVWLLELESSAEARWGLMRDLADQVANPIADRVAGDRRSNQRVVPASATMGSDTPTAVELIEQGMPALLAEPKVRCCLASIQRRSGNRAALQLWGRLGRAHALGSWSQCGRGEVWLAKHVGLAPKPTTVCLRTAERPELDGILDEALWEEREILQLTSATEDDARWKATVQLARDEEYLYWGIACRKAAGQDYETSTAPRPHDSDLSDRDRVELLIDVDRDYATFYRMTVDHRGWTNDTCFGEASWNPQWYVATSSDETTWTAEIAIPLSELVPHTPARNDVWAIGVQRVVPGIGFQSWNHPANADAQPEGFGYLRF